MIGIVPFCPLYADGVVSVTLRIPARIACCQAVLPGHFADRNGNCFHCAPGTMSLYR